MSTAHESTEPADFAEGPQPFAGLCFSRHASDNARSASRVSCMAICYAFAHHKGSAWGSSTIGAASSRPPPGRDGSDDGLTSGGDINTFNNDAL